MKRTICLVAVTALAATLAAGDAGTKATPLTLVVMDPLALPLSCPCVKGYAQRDYDRLGTFLAEKLGRPVTVAFAESLTGALKNKTEGKADVVIGRNSAVLHDAKKAGMSFTPAASLTGKDGKTTQTGLVVVLKDNPAKTVDDLKEYKVIYGCAEAEEKHAAVMVMLKNRSFVIPDKPETCTGCDEGAGKLLEAGPDARMAAVISSYAKPLLEGCGTVPKGALRVVAETEPVPFVVAFCNDALPPEVREAVTQALRKVSDEPELKTALETKNGFVRPPESAKKK